MSDELRAQVSEHTARIGVLEERSLSAKADITEIKNSLATNNKLIVDVDSKVISLHSFLKGAAWLLGMGFTALALVVSYAALTAAQ